MDFFNSIGKHVEGFGKEVWKKIEEPSKETLDLVKARIPATREWMNVSGEELGKEVWKKIEEPSKETLDLVKARIPATREWMNVRGEELGKEVWKKIEEPSKETLDLVKARIPATREWMNVSGEELKGKWTPVLDAVVHNKLPAATKPQAIAEKPTPNPQEERPWSSYQDVKPDALKNLELIQRGGFGDIYRGRSQMWGLDIALKIIRGLDSHTMKELMKEAKMMKIADFPYVLRLLGLYQRKEGEFVEYGLVMEYMPNGSLYTLFRSINPVPWALRFQILHQVALGMNYLHLLRPPLLHLDLKPKNVLLDHSLDVRLADFGLSKLKNITSSSGGGGVGGTLPYMAPEALDDINYRPREPFDVYSYGILTWSVLSAQEPYPNAGTDLIKLKVPQGQRPDEKELEHLDSIKMVPQAKDLMRCCWNEDADARPPFSESIKRTEPMFVAYSAEKDEAIRSVQDQLKKPVRQELDETDSDFESEGSSVKTENSESFHSSLFASN